MHAVTLYWKGQPRTINLLIKENSKVEKSKLRTVGVLQDVGIARTTISTSPALDELKDILKILIIISLLQVL